MTLEPRLDPDEIEYLNKFLLEKPDGTKMVEWGSGGSTLMFLPHFETGSFTSIEHNRDWFDKVTVAVQAALLNEKVLGNFTYCYRPPMVDIRFYGYGVPFEENPCFSRDYIDPDDSDAGIHIWDADVYFVDGICRGAILATILTKASNRNATVFIHDYFGPENRWSWYEWSSKLYSKVEQVGSTLARLTI